MEGDLRFCRTEILVQLRLHAMIWGPSHDALQGSSLHHCSPHLCPELKHHYSAKPCCCMQFMSAYKLNML